MGLYGNFLMYFTGLMKDYAVFKQEPLVGAGFSKIEGSDLTVRGMIQTFDEGSALNIRDAYSRSAKSIGAGEGVASVIDEKLFWCTKDLPLSQYYVIIGGVVYRFLTNGSWNEEAGFYEYLIHRVVGVDGVNHTEPLALIQGDFS